MLVVMKPGAPREEVKRVQNRLMEMNLEIRQVDGDQKSVFALLGDTSKLDLDTIVSNQYVEKIMRIQEPYKLASRAFHPDDTVIEVGDCKIGGGNKVVIAGPCSVESVEQMVETAIQVKKAGASMLRGGAYKPRSSPYSF